MKGRCYNVNDYNYSNYGGRGLTVCEEWMQSFGNFYKDMGDRPEGMTLDRIDNEEGYSPNNCKWSTPREQNLNQRIRSTNKSGVIGVCYSERDKVWRATASEAYKQINLGVYRDKQDAIEARKAYEREQLGIQG